MLKHAALMLTFLTSLSASATDVCDALRSPRRLQPQLANCESIVRRGLVRDARALRYTINYMVKNHNGLRDPSCALNRLQPQPAYCSNCADESFIRRGINNQCSFILNDMQQGWVGRNDFEDRTTGYFVDLCATNVGDLVKKFPMNGSRGRPKFSDRPLMEEGTTGQSNSSTLAGAFMLNDDVTFDFVVKTPSASYDPIIRRFIPQNPPVGGVPVVRMVGLNASNNSTEYDKPLHVSAYDRGKGCPGIEPDDYPIMEAAVSRGSSLYMAYAGREYEQRGIIGAETQGSQTQGSCKNDPRDPQDLDGRSANGPVAPASTSN